MARKETTTQKLKRLQRKWCVGKATMREILWVRDEETHRKVNS